MLLNDMVSFIALWSMSNFILEVVECCEASSLGVERGNLHVQA